MFADDVIGFYIEGEDRLSGTLVRATHNYDRFVRDLTKLSERAYRTVSRAMERMGGLMDSFMSMPAGIQQRYQKAVAALQRSMKPLRQKIEIEFTSRSTQNIRKVITDALTSAFGKMRLRLRPSLPTSRSALFDESVSLRSAYRTIAQPPDYVGALRIPGYLKGGVVGGKPGPDANVVRATRGEGIVPNDTMTKLREFLDNSVSNGGPALRDAKGRFRKRTMEEVLLDPSQTRPMWDAAEATLKWSKETAQLIGEMTSLKTVIDAGIASNGQVSRYQELLDLTDKSLERVTKSSQKLSVTSKQLVAPAIGMLRNEFDRLKPEVEEVSELLSERLLKGVFGSVRFLAFAKAAEVLRSQLHELSGSASEFFGGEEMKSSLKSALSLNRVLGLTRSQARGLVADSVAVGSTFTEAFNPSEVGEAQMSLVEAGEKNLDQLRRMGFAVALMAKGFKGDADEIAKSAYTLTSSLGIGNEQAFAIMANSGKMAETGSASFAQLNESMMENIKAGGVFFRMIAKSPEERVRALTELNRVTDAMVTNWGAAGGQLAEIMSRAASMDPEAIATVGRLGVSFQEIQQGLLKGDLSGVVGKVGTNVQRLAQNPAALESLKDVFGSTFDAGQLAAFAQNQDKVVKRMDDMRSHGIKMGDALQYAADKAIQSQTGMSGFFNTISNFLFTHGGKEVLSFMGDLKIETLAAGAIFAKTAIDLLGFVGSLKLFSRAKDAIGGTRAGKAFSWLAPTKKIGDVVGTGGGVTGGLGSFIGDTATGLTKGVTAMIQGLLTTVTSTGKAIGGVVTSVLGPVIDLVGRAGVSIGTAIGSILTGLATGLSALGPALAVFAAPHVILGTAIVTGAVAIGVLAIGAAMRLAAPGIEAFGKAALASFSGIAQVLASLSTLDPLMFLAMGPGLTGLAIGLGALFALDLWAGIGRGIASFFGLGGNGVIDMLERLGKMAPNLGLFAGVAERIQKLDFAGLEKRLALTATVTGIYMGTIGGPAALSQTLPTPVVSASDIDAVVAAVVARSADSAVHADLQETNRLLAKILGEVGQPRSEGAGQPAPAPSRRDFHPATRDIAGFR